MAPPAEGQSPAHCPFLWLAPIAVLAAEPVDGRCPECGAVATPSETAGTGLPTRAQTSSRDAPTRLSNAGDAATIPPSGPTVGSGQQRGSTTGPLHVSENFGSRYHVIRLLGAGGMGSVYQAWDQELEVAVAIKVIRPETMADPAVAREIEKRFKRELLLARQVTHRNVVRIHDIGEIDGIKYITMPYVHGSDLATILTTQGRMPVGRALGIARQVVSGLAAAHEANVVHRDLKPANIMIDAEDHALIMDFGIARSTAGETGFTMTAAGAVVGTVAYMAPEQAKGGAVDQRADVYAFGLILRDMLLGSRHAGATTEFAELMARMQKAPPPMRTLDATIPEPLDALVTRCLQPEPAARYQTSAALLADLERVAAGDSVEPGPADKGSTAPGRGLAARRPALRAAVAAAVLLVLGVGAYGGWRFYRAATGAGRAGGSAGPSVSLAVLPFRNASGDPSLDSLGTSLSEVLATDLGESAQIRAVPSVRLREVLRDLRVDPNANLSPADLARIADFASAKTILWGQYVKFGEEIRIDATLQNLDQQQTTPLKATAANQAGLLAAVGQLAGSVQQALAAGSADVLNELKASAWRPSTQSFEALRLYNDGLNLLRDGNQPEAAKRFEAAVAEDQNFALAYSALAETYANLGYDAKAQQQSRRALDMSASLPVQERYLIAATHYRLTHDSARGIETYEKLLTVSPNNARIRFDLARLYEQTGDLAKAQEHFAQAVTLDPKYSRRVDRRRPDRDQARRPEGGAAAAEQRDEPVDSVRQRRRPRERPAGDRRCVQEDGPTGRGAEAVPGVAGHQAEDRGSAGHGGQPEGNRTGPGEPRERSGGRQELQRGPWPPARTLRSIWHGPDVDRSRRSAERDSRPTRRGAAALPRGALAHA